LRRKTTLWYRSYLDLKPTTDRISLTLSIFSTMGLNGNSPLSQISWLYTRVYFFAIANPFLLLALPTSGVDGSVTLGDGLTQRGRYSGDGSHPVESRGKDPIGSLVDEPPKLIGYLFWKWM